MVGKLSRRSHVTLGILSTALLLALGWLIYLPGLHGGFLFDDFANLPPLGDSGPIDNWPAFWRFITSGHADPTGRPLSMLSFLLDARDWPAAPFPFKRTNLLLHLCNGGLLILLLRQLGRQLWRPTCEASHIQIKNADAWRIDAAAVVGAAFWLLHPLWASTTLYIVQREAILPATFTLIGLMLWLHGRGAIAQGKKGAGLLAIASGLGVCTVLAMLCKANGILLPALALAVEYCLPKQANRETQATYRWVMYVFAWLPAMLIAIYLTWEGWHGLLYGISSTRPWTLEQRLLTEPRVLVDYLALLWLPRPFTAGLFNDQFAASATLWQPATTLPAIVMVLSLIAWGLWKHKRLPAAAMAILFYFVGQALESSTVALELYFEHRNYLPAMLMFWPIALWLCSAYPQSQRAGSPTDPAQPAHSLSFAKLGLGLLLLLSLSAMTHAAAQLWGNEKDQALLWAKLNPESPRAQVNAAETEMGEGRPDLAAQRLRALLGAHPDQVQLALNLFGAECLMGNVPDSTLDAARLSLRTTRDPGALLTSWFSRVIEQAKRPPCPQLTYETVNNLLNTALTNPYFRDAPGRLQDLYYLKGLLALQQGQLELVQQNFDHALKLQVRPALALKQAALLGASGHPQLGLDHLALYESLQSEESPPDLGMPRVHAWVLQRQQYWPHEIARLQATLQKDAMPKATGGS